MLDAHRSRFRNSLLVFTTIFLASVPAGWAIETVTPHSENGIGRGLSTGEATMIRGLAGWESTAAFTVGERVLGYTAPGKPDGMGIMELDHRRVRVFVNHELHDDDGYAYSLANGTTLTGARVSYFDFHRQSRKLLGAGPAYTRVIDRYGVEVTAARQINEGSRNPGTDGLDRLCSAWLGLAGQYGLVDDAFFTGEENGNGQEFVLDARAGVLHCAPALGRAAFESAAMIDHPDPERVAVVFGDDRAGAPLLVYIGTRNALDNGGFLDRNGLARGQLHVWVSDDGARSPADFNGTGALRTGKLVAIDIFAPDMAGLAGYDQQGYANQSKQDALTAAAGAFRFSRPEDVATDPADGTRVVYASTGRSAIFGGADSWGTTYLIDFDLAAMTANLTIAYDGDDAGGGQFAGPDFGLRSPDNLAWGEDGMIYIQEDRSIGSFGRISGEEASLWQLDPATGVLTRVGQVDRRAVPAGQYDANPNGLGAWETSGVIDVTSFFRTAAKERLLLVATQAHGVRGGVIDRENLDEGGQLLFMSAKAKSRQEKPVADKSAVAAAIRIFAGPNPFNPRTIIRFTLPEPTTARLDILDVRGRVVRTLLDDGLGQGEHRYAWNGNDDAGLPVASGRYFYRLSAGVRVLGGKLLLVK